MFSPQLQILLLLRPIYMYRYRGALTSGAGIGVVLLEEELYYEGNRSTIYGWICIKYICDDIFGGSILKCDYKSIKLGRQSIVIKILSFMQKTRDKTTRIFII